MEVVIVLKITPHFVGFSFCHNLLNKSMNFVNNDGRFLVNSPFGYVSFDSITKRKDDSLRVCFRTSSLRCSPNHLVKTREGFKNANALRVGDFVFPNEVVVSVSLSEPTDLYDLVNVDNPENAYYTNSVVSHNCEFAGSSSTLIDGELLVKMKFKTPIHTNKDETIRYWEVPQKGHTYVMTVDVSRGRDLDYSALIVFDVTEIPYKVVATLKDNNIPIIKFPLLIGQIATTYNEAYILIENNDLGESVCNDLWFTQEYGNVLWTKNGKIAGGAGATIGIRTTKQVKVRGCGAIKEIIEKGQIVLNDFRILEELGVYVQNNRGTYEAQDTHINDDLCSCLFLFGYFSVLDYFKDLTNTNITKKLMDRYEQQLEDDIVPVGFFPQQSDEEENQKLSEEQISLLNTLK